MLPPLPPLRLPSNAITYEKVLQHYPSAQGRYGGTGTVPSFIVAVLFISFYDEKNFTDPGT
jgi:hypothetical protein